MKYLLIHRGTYMFFLMFLGRKESLYTIPVSEFAQKTTFGRR